jgi:hypothetical protein
MFVNNIDVTAHCTFTGGATDGTIALDYATYGALADGTYRVVVNGTCSLDGSTLSDTVTFTRETPPVADFTADVTGGIAPLTVQFTDLSSEDPTGWAWYFGDENFANPWAQMTNRLGQRYAHTSVALPDGSIVLMGGYNTSGILVNDVWRSTDNGATWTQMTASAGWSARSFTPAWHFLTAALY